jgi:hypothetical protein
VGDKKQISPGEALAAFLKGDVPKEVLDDANEKWAESVERNFPGTKVTFDKVISSDKH